LRIKPLALSEAGELRNFPPEDWSLDLPAFIALHFGQSYFYPIIAEVQDKIVGYANGMVHGGIGWLGNIIVAPEFRRQGIGHELTGHLTEYLKSRGCTSQLLIATEMGKNIYSRIGFRTCAEYLFYRGKPTDPTRQSRAIREIGIDDIPSLAALDKETTGEDRFDLIKRFLSRTWVYAPEPSGGVRGAYLPEFGAGLIIARDSDAGLELMKFRLSRGETAATVPSANTAAREFLEKEGFEAYRTAPRMVLGDDAPWKPELLYNRATGYCG
jgi:ribosomal protein S18 acetylase RimI-like enzyme